MKHIKRDLIGLNQCRTQGRCKTVDIRLESCMGQGRGGGATIYLTQQLKMIKITLLRCTNENESFLNSQPVNLHCGTKMIKLKKCNIKNWDGSTITPLIQIKDRTRVKLRYLELINSELSNKTINYRFHDEPSRIINDLIRWCHGCMGMYSQTKTGCLYKEQGILKQNSVVEHTVTVSDLVKLYFSKKINLGLLLFLPVTLLSNKSNELLHKNSKTNADICYPFRRYFNVGINNIINHNGDLIDLNKYHLIDHFKLVKETISNTSHLYNSELMEIFNYFEVGDSLEEFLISISESSNQPAVRNSD